MAGTSFIFSTILNTVLDVYKTLALNIMLCNLELIGRGINKDWNNFQFWVCFKRYRHVRDCSNNIKWMCFQVSCVTWHIDSKLMKWACPSSYPLSLILLCKSYLMSSFFISSMKCNRTDFTTWNCCFKFRSGKEQTSKQPTRPKKSTLKLKTQHLIWNKKFVPTQQLWKSTSQRC